MDQKNKKREPYVIVPIEGGRVEIPGNLLKKIRKPSWTFYIKRKIRTLVADNKPVAHFAVEVMAADHSS